MKAKHIRKIKDSASWYKVVHTCGLFGDFSRYKFDRDAELVLARTPIEAVIRAKRRGYGLEHTYSKHGRSPNWARWMVKLAHKNNHWRNLYYF